MRVGLAFAAVIAAAMFGVGQAQAAQMIFTETTTASGTLGGSAFTNALITISGRADTSAVFSPAAGIYAIANIPLTLTVQGLGTAEFSDAMNVTSNQNSQAVGFGDITEKIALLFTNGVNNAGYDLSTPFGPVTDGAAGPLPWTTFATDQGAFHFSPIPVSATFQATLAAVPEPSTWLMTIGGLGMLGAMLRRRRVHAAA